MYLYYTAKQGNELEQLKPFLSLGGFKSSTKVQNSKMGNLFSDISNLTITNYNQNQYIALVLKNESASDKTNINFWFVYPNKCYSKLRIAAADMVSDASGILQMEGIENLNCKPIYANFYDAEGEDNKVNIGDLLVNEQVGIWIERSLLLDFIKLDQSNIYQPSTAPDKQGRYEEIILGKEDDIKMMISWD